MSLMQRGFTRLQHEGKQIDLSSPDDYPRDDFEDVYALVDRLVARADIRQRLVDSLETCFREGHGQAVIELSEPPAVAGGKTQLDHIASDSPNVLNASTTAQFTRRPNRACSASIIRSALVRPVRVSATQSVWISTS